MIARHTTDTEGRNDIWADLAAPLPDGVISWRQDGRPAARDGKFFARFVAYIEANTVRERLDTVIAGEWDLTLELLPAMPQDESGSDTAIAFKARLAILGVIREDVGTGRDYKQAATDAFKRAAVRYGIGHELYAYEQNWVQVDGDGKFAKPLEDPTVAYARRMARTVNDSQVAPKPREVSMGSYTPEESTSAAPAADEPSCPKCSGRMWDNRLTRRNPKAPLYKCRSRSCDGVIWPPRTGVQASSEDDAPPPSDSDLPF